MIAAAVAVLVAAFATTVLVLLVEHTRPVALSALTGPYRVGRAAFDWVEEIQGIYDRLPPSRLLMILGGSGHFSLSDNPLIFNCADSDIRYGGEHKPDALTKRRLPPAFGRFSMCI